MTRETKQPKDGRNETSSSRTSSLRDHQKWSRQTTNIDLRNQTPGTQWFAENMTKITKEIGQNQHHQINDTYHIQQSAESPFYPEQRQIQQQNQQHLHQEIYYGNEPSSFSYQQIDQFQDTYFPPYPPQDTLQKVRPFRTDQLQQISGYLHIAVSELSQQREQNVQELWQCHIASLQIDDFLKKNNLLPGQELSEKEHSNFLLAWKSINSNDTLKKVISNLQTIKQQELDKQNIELGQMNLPAERLKLSSQYLESEIGFLRQQANLNKESWKAIDIDKEMASMDKSKESLLFPKDEAKKHIKYMKELYLENIIQKTNKAREKEYDLKGYKSKLNKIQKSQQEILTKINTLQQELVGYITITQFLDTLSYNQEVQEVAQSSEGQNKPEDFLKPEVGDGINSRLFSIKKDDFSNLKVINIAEVSNSMKNMITATDSQKLMKTLSDGRTVYATVEVMKQTFKRFREALNRQGTDNDAWNHFCTLYNDAKCLKKEKAIKGGISALNNIRFEKKGYNSLNGSNLEKAEDITNLKVINKAEVNNNMRELIRRNDENTLKAKLSDERTVYATVEAMKRTFKKFWEALDCQQTDDAWNHFCTLRDDVNRLQSEKKLSKAIAVLSNIRFEEKSSIVAKTR